MNDAADEPQRGRRSIALKACAERSRAFGRGFLAPYELVANQRRFGREQLMRFVLHDDRTHLDPIGELYARWLAEALPTDLEPSP
jgi:hypothetical protein